MWSIENLTDLRLVITMPYQNIVVEKMESILPARSNSSMLEFTPCLMDGSSKLRREETREKRLKTGRQFMLDM
uniref:Uncharacterized protein n=1 Tax=Megaselia scalaris TaxID=36166 RepID=T1GT68_MEGSC